MIEWTICTYQRLYKVDSLWYNRVVYWFSHSLICCLPVHVGLVLYFSSILLVNSIRMLWDIMICIALNNKLYNAILFSLKKPYFRSILFVWFWWFYKFSKLFHKKVSQGLETLRGICCSREIDSSHPKVNITLISWIAPIMMLLGAISVLS